MIIDFDFNLQYYLQIIKCFKDNNYNVVTFYEFHKLKKNLHQADKILVLRHDVDRFVSNSLKMAELESVMGIHSTYFFRIIKSVFNPNVIRQISNMGHEIGYHYEDLTTCRGNYKKAIKNFETNLNRIRAIVPVKTICMHGSPLTPWDNKNLWIEYNYKKYGIIADTFFDVDYDDVFYITDNGFGWNLKSVSIRDKVVSKFNIKIKSSEHLVELINQNSLPNHIMLNAHPDSFFDLGVKWSLNNVFIKIKNIFKWVIVKTDIYK